MMKMRKKEKRTKERKKWNKNKERNVKDKK